MCWQWRATGTVWRIYHSGGVDAGLAGEAARLVEEDEARWSRFRAGSDIARINSAAGRPVTVDPRTIDLVEAALAWSRDTNGVFNPLVGAVLEDWGYASRVASPAFGGPQPVRAEPGAVRGSVSVDRVRRTVRMSGGVRLDPGGIGKSWIAARVARLLRGRSSDGSVLVDAGGDLVAVRGAHRVAVDDSSQREAPIGYLTVPEGWGIATSGWARRSWVREDGRAVHHLIDPATGEPGRRAHASVLDPDPVAADVLATVLTLRPHDAAASRRICRACCEGTVWASPSWQVTPFDDPPPA